MGKRSKILLICGAAAIGIISVLIVIVSLIASGAISLTQEKIVFASQSAEFAYDGQAHTCQEWYIADGELKAGHTAEVSVLGSQTAVGKSSNSIYVVIYDSSGVDVTDYYNIEYQEGTLTVYAVSITVESDSAEKIYDGTPLSAESYSIYGGQLLSGHKEVVTFTNTITEAGKKDNYFNINIYDAEGNDQTSCYDINCIYGELAVYYGMLEIYTDSAEKVYDGTPLTEDGWVKTGTVASGHSVIVTLNQSITNVGTIENTPYITVTDAYGAIVTEYYKITYYTGTLTVTPYSIKMYTASAAMEYDGTALTDGGWSIYSANGILDGQSIAVNVYGSQTGVGQSENVADVAIYDSNGGLVTSNYEIEMTYGTLTVTAIKITIISGSATKPFDGKPLTCSDYAVTPEDSIPSTQTLVVTVTGSRTYKGEAENTFTATIYGTNTGGSRIDVTDNYDITYQYGELVVTGEAEYYESDISVGSNQLDAGNLYSFVAQKDGVYLLYGGGSFTVNYSNGNSYTVGAGEEYEIELAAGESVEIGANSDMTLDVVGLYALTEGNNYLYDGLTYYFDAQSLGTYSLTLIGSGSAEIIYNGNDFILNSGDTVDFDLSSGERLYVYADGDSTLVIGEDIDTAASAGSAGDSEADSGEGEASGELNKTGDISGGSLDDSTDEDGDPSTVLSIYSDMTGTLYLKVVSYGSYNGNGWEQAAAYSTLLDGIYGMDYLYGSALANSGYSATYFQIASNTSDYLLPYYLAMASQSYSLGYDIQTSDIYYTGSLSTYSGYVYYYDYITSGSGSLQLSSAYTSAEKAYRSYVHNYYTSTGSDSTTAYLQSIIKEQGFDKITDTYTLVKAVVSYIQNAATYNLNYDRNLDSEEDIAIAFLSTYKEGICQHFASAATLLFRALGIPARYTNGYVASTTAGKWAEVTSEKAHAWTEIYIDGLGWVTVDATGGAGGYGADLSTDSGSGSGSASGGNSAVTEGSNELGAGETYNFTSDEGGTYSFTGDGDFTITTGDGNTYEIDAGDIFDMELGEGESIEISTDADMSLEIDDKYSLDLGDSQLEAGGSYDFTADADGTYTFTGDSGFTITDSEGNTYDISAGETAEVELAEGESIEISSDSDMSLEIDDKYSLDVGGSQLEGGSSYDFTADADGTYTFTGDSAFTITDGDGNTYDVNAGDSVDIELGEGESVNISADGDTTLDIGSSYPVTEGESQLTGGGDYYYTADTDGTYTFTGDGDFTITDSDGNTYDVAAGETFDMELAAGESVDISTGGDMSLDIEQSFAVTEGESQLTGGETYGFTADTDGTYTFTGDSDFTITDGDGNTYGVNAGESFDIELGEGESVDISTDSDMSLDIDGSYALDEGASQVAGGGDYYFTADEDGTYTFTGDSDFTITDGNGNTYDVNAGDSVDIELGEGESVDISSSGDMNLDIDSSYVLNEGNNLLVDGGDYYYDAEYDGNYSFSLSGDGSVTITDGDGNEYELSGGESVDLDLSAGDVLDVVADGASKLVIGVDTDAVTEGTTLDTSGSISGGGNASSESTVLSIYSDTTGKLYLKLINYGDYSGSGWEQATEYTALLNGVYGMDYLYATALAESGYSASYFEIDSTSYDYLLPYYLAMQSESYTIGYDIQTSDVYYTGTSTAYSGYVYYYDYINEYTGSLQLSSAYTAAERSYRNFVYANYTDVGADSTAAYLQSIIEEQGFDKITDTYELVCAVVNYIKNAATYNLSYDTALDSEEDIVVAFLSTYKEGICQHYASAATLMFRQLGIPARYTGGYVATTKAGKWTDVTTSTAHAWTEIYLDGLGWVVVDATGGGVAVDGAGSYLAEGSNAVGAGGNYSFTADEDGTYTFTGDSDFTITDSEGNTYSVSAGETYDMPLGEGESVNVSSDTDMSLDIDGSYSLSEGESQITGGSDYYYEADADGTYSFTGDSDFTITDGDGTIYGVGAGETVDIPLSEGESVNISSDTDMSLDIDSSYSLGEGESQLTGGSDYYFEADSDGTYSFTGDSDFTITDSEGNTYDVEAGETFDMDFNAGDSVDISSDSDMSLEIDDKYSLSEGTNEVGAGETYDFTADSDGTYSFTGDSDFTITDSEGNTQNVAAGETIDVELGEGDSVEISSDSDMSLEIDDKYSLSEGANEVEAGGEYDFTADSDGTYSFTGESDFTITDSEGNTYDVAADETYNMDLEKGESVDITSDDDMSLQIDVTEKTDSDGSGSDSSGSDDKKDKEEYIVKPVNEYYLYDNTAHSYSGTKLQGLTKLTDLGYTYEFTVSGSRKALGITTTTITSFTLYDPSGNDVTDSFNIKLTQGKLQVYIVKIDVTTGSAKMEYNGTTLTSSDIYFDEYKLISGHTAVYSTTGAITNVGKVTNTYTITVYDENGDDVTDWYYFVSTYGTLEVTACEITVTAATDSKKLDGTPLTNDGYTTEGLPDGFYLYAEVTGSQTYPGYCSNVIQYVKVYDSKGNDVTTNFTIIMVNGTLTITVM